PGALLLDGGAGGVVEGGREGDLDAAAALVDALAPVHGEPGGRVETAQVGAPEVLVGGRVALAEGWDEVPEGPRRVGGERAALGATGGVAAEDLAEAQAGAPAAEEAAAVAPPDRARRAAGPPGDQAHPRRLGHVAAAPPGLSAELPPGVAGAAPAAPVR